MEKALKLTLMVQNIKESGKMILLLEKDKKVGQVVPFTKVNGKMKSSMAKALQIILMVQNMKDLG